jgi:hypothetical protein
MANTSGRITQAKATKQRKLQLKKDTLKNLAPKSAKAVKGGMRAAPTGRPTDACFPTNLC